MLCWVTYWTIHTFDYLCAVLYVEIYTAPLSPNEFIFIVKISSCLIVVFDFDQYKEHLKMLCVTSLQY